MRSESKFAKDESATRQGQTWHDAALKISHDENQASHLICRVLNVLETALPRDPFSLHFSEECH